MIIQSSQCSYKVLNVRTEFFGRDCEPPHHADSLYIWDRLPKVWSHAPLCNVGQKRPISSKSVTHVRQSYLNAYQLFGHSSKKTEMKDSYMNVAANICSQTCKNFNGHDTSPVVIISLVRALMFFGH